MNWSDSVSSFWSKYKVEAFKRGMQVPNFTNAEVMMLLSEIQQDLQSRYNLSKTEKIINFTAGANAINLSTGSAVIISGGSSGGSSTPDLYYSSMIDQDIDFLLIEARAFTQMIEAGTGTVSLYTSSDGSTYSPISLPFTIPASNILRVAFNGVTGTKSVTIR